MPCSREPRGAAQRGFTLVEVMVASAMLGVLVLGLTNLWTVFDRMSFDLLIRQKAAFVLEGEMGRLTALYGTTAFGAGLLPLTTGYMTLNNVPAATVHTIYATGSTGVTFAVASATTFSGSDSLVWATGFGTAARNYVWIDRGRNLMGRLSWVPCPVSNATADVCWNAANAPKNPTPSNCYPFNGITITSPCLLVILVLEYPFRLTGGAAVATTINLTALTLSTIVGRRE